MRCTSRSGSPISVVLGSVALVASVMFPFGRMLFPYVANEVGDLEFGAIQAVLSTAIGFGIYAALFV